MAGLRRPDFRRHLPSLPFVALFLALAAAALGLFVYIGLYDVGADAPHSRLVSWGLETLRDSAVSHHARGIDVPANLGDPARIAAGAGLYDEMCSGCHLAPGMERTEISQGLYPAAPELARGTELTPAEQFWAIKHGIKLSAMPAWGRTHNDQLIWDMVAFLQRLPRLSPAQYRAAVASAPADHDEMMHAMPEPHGAAHGGEPGAAGNDDHDHH